MPTATRTTKTSPPGRLAAAAVALGSCLALACPAGSAQAASAEPVPTVFFGDAYTSNYGLAPYEQSDVSQALCFRSKENYGAVAARTLAERGIPLNTQADVSCRGAHIEHFWTEQRTHPDHWHYTRPPQQEALRPDTRLVVGSLGRSDFSLVSMLKQCSEELRGAERTLLPENAVDGHLPAAECADFFTSEYGKGGLEYATEQLNYQMSQLLISVEDRSPRADLVVVGHPRLVPADATKCETAAPGRAELPFADIPADTLRIIDGVQKKLNDAVKEVVTESGGHFVDLYSVTGAHTACDGTDRGIGGLSETTARSDAGHPLPWYGHPNAKGRDLQAQHVAAKVEEILGS